MQTQENVKELDIVCPHKTVPALVKARAEGSPDKTYMYFQDKAWTYKEFHEITGKTADAFLKLGAKKGAGTLERRRPTARGAALSYMLMCAGRWTTYPRRRNVRGGAVLSPQDTRPG